MGQVTPTKRTNKPKAASSNGHRKPLTYDHLKSKKKPVTRRVPIPLDSEVVDRFEAARDAYDNMRDIAAAKLSLAQAEEAENPGAVQAELARQQRITEEFEEAQAELDETTVVVVLQSRGHKAYEKLVADHPATEQDHENAREISGEADAKAEYHHDSFMPALVAMCSAEPEMTAEQVEELWEDWNLAEQGHLFMEAWQCCQRSNVGKTGKGYGQTGGSSRS